jgi:hypothetical protein
MLAEEFLKPLGRSNYRLAKKRELKTAWGTDTGQHEADRGSGQELPGDHEGREDLQ